MNKKLVGPAKVPIIDLKATGNNISKLRKKAGLSVRDLQSVMGFTNPQAIYKWQSGTCLPSIDNLLILSVVLGVSLDDLLITEEQSTEDSSANYQAAVWKYAS